MQLCVLLRVHDPSQPFAALSGVFLGRKRRTKARIHILQVPLPFLLFFIKCFLLTHSHCNRFTVLKELEQRMRDIEGGLPVEVRLKQGKEPKEFARLFGGQMVIHKGMLCFQMSLF